MLIARLVKVIIYNIFAHYSLSEIDRSRDKLESECIVCRCVVTDSILSSVVTDSIVYMRVFHNNTMLFCTTSVLIIL